MDRGPEMPPRPVSAIVAAAGLTAPVAFTVAVIVQGILQSDYSHIALPISALAAWPHGWVQNLNFVVLGLSIIALAVVLNFTVRPGSGGILGPGLLALCGMGVLLAAAFPWQCIGEEFVVPTGHVVGAVLTFLGAGTGLVVLSRRMSHDPLWRSLASYTLASGIAILALFMLTGMARAEASLMHPWLGLLQRLMLVVWFPSVMVLALRLWRVA